MLIQIEGILQKAKDLGLEIVPLVQTFGHLEWILKLEEFAHLREDPKYPQVICFGSHESWVLIQDMITQVGQFHKR
jgi:hexosaminidase